MKKIVSYCFSTSGRVSVATILILSLVGISAFIGIQSFAQKNNAQPVEDFQNQELSYTDKIEQIAVFPEHILFVGNIPPSEEESEQLYNLLINTISDPESKFWRPALERFIQQNPDSAWGPSLRANLAQHYAREGRYSRALGHWEAAWEIIKGVEVGLESRQEKLVKSQILADWSRVLSSLGRVEKLKELYVAVGDDPLDGARYYVLFHRSLEALEAMIGRPERSFRCGSLALSNVAKALGAEGDVLQSIVHMDSPVEGFSISELKGLGDDLEIDFVPAFFPNRKEIVVPSVVHWKENHYAAILDEREGEYLVKDPTFYLNAWVDKEIVHEESSGYFLIPSSRSEGKSFEVIADLAAKDIRGRGFPSNFEDDMDETCPKEETEDQSEIDGSMPISGLDPNNESDCVDCPGPAEGGTGGTEDCGGGCGGCQGMPVWTVSEPYINLWMRDTPVFYTQKSGKVMNFTVSYKQRNARATSFVFGFGPLWESNFLSFIDDDGSGIEINVRGGGIRKIPNAQLGQAYYRDKSVTTYDSVADDYVVEYVSGAKNIYGVKSVYGFKDPLTSTDRYFLAESIDKQGRSTKFKYTEVSNYVHLTQIVDHYGETTNIAYGTGANAHKIASITPPHSRSASFGYHTSGRLNSITDAESLQSTLVYNTSGFITSLTTPYGTTSFNLLRDESIASTATPNPDLNRVNRCIIATYPNSSKEMWLYRNQSEKLNGGTGSSTYLVPKPEWDVPSTVPYSNKFDPDTHLRNSFHWRPKQYALLGTFKTSLDFEDLQVKHYKWSHRKQWLHAGQSNDGVGSTINMERLPSRDLSPSNDRTVRDWGQSTWYDYEGKSQQSHSWEGTQSLPLLVASVVDYNETTGYEHTVYTRYERNSDGKVTEQITGYSIIDPSSSNSYNEITDFEYDYDSNGRLHEVKDSSGNLIKRITYNTSNQVELIKDFRDGSDSADTDYVYSGGKLEEVIYPTGLKVDIVYNGNSRVSSLIYKKSAGTTIGTESFTYSKGKVYTYTDLRGLQKTFTYDDLDRLTRITYPDTTYVNIQYDKLDVWKVTDRLGHLTEYTHNNMGWLTHVKDPNLDTTVYDYCTCGLLESHTTPLGEKTEYTYHPDGSLKDIDYPDVGPTVIYNYNYDSTINTINDGQVVTTFDYDDYRRRDKVEIPGGTLFEITEFYDEGLPKKVTAEGVEYYYTYDFQNRIREKYVETDGVSGNSSNDGKQEWIYNDKGLYQVKFSQTSSITRTTTYTRDEFGRTLTSHKDGVNQTTTYQYKPSGDLWKLTDPANHTTEWNYDTEGRLDWKKDQAGTTVLTYDWDANGNLTNRWSIAKGNTSYVYDDENKLTNINYSGSGASNVTYNYNEDDELVSMIDGIGTTTFTYKGTGQLESEDGPYVNDKITYSYNKGRRSGLTIDMPSGPDWVASYTYDSSGRLDDVVSPAGTFTYTYPISNNITRPASIDLPGSLKIEYGYHTETRRLQDTWLKYGTTIKNHHHYKHNLAGWKTEHKLPNGTTSILTHDAIGQLTKATSYNGTTYDYAYDDGWNLDYRKLNGSTEQFTTNNKNELTQVPAPGSVTPTYDTNGNMTYDGINGNYTYDAENRVTEAIWYDGTDYWKENYFYDGLSRIRYTWKYKDLVPGAGVWNYLGGKLYYYDGMVLLQERDINNTTINATYTYGKDVSGSINGAGGIGGILAADLGGTTAYYHSDGTGNVTRLVNSTGGVLATYEYDPFGYTTAQSGSLAATNRMKFSSKMEMDNGNYYYGFRFYSPYLQRWLNRDPLGESGGVNLYGFVRNAVLRAVDPYGLIDSLRWPQNAALYKELCSEGLGYAMESTTGVNPLDVLDAKDFVKSLPKNLKKVSRQGKKGPESFKIKTGPDGIARINGRRVRGYKFAGGKRVEIPIKKSGFPDFSSVAGARVFCSPRDLTGNRKKDEAFANRMLRFPHTPKGWTWHHVETGNELQLVPIHIHNAVPHTGSAAILNSLRDSFLDSLENMARKQK